MSIQWNTQEKLHEQGIPPVGAAVSRVSVRPHKNSPRLTLTWARTEIQRGLRPWQEYSPGMCHTVAHSDTRKWKAHGALVIASASLGVYVLTPRKNILLWIHDLHTPAPPSPFTHISHTLELQRLRDFSQCCLEETYITAFKHSYWNLLCDGLTSIYTFKWACGSKAFHILWKWLSYINLISILSYIYIYLYLYFHHTISCPHI